MPRLSELAYKERVYPDELVTLEIGLPMDAAGVFSVTYSTAAFRQAMATLNDAENPALHILSAVVGWDLMDDAGIAPLKVDWSGVPLAFAREAYEGLIADATQHVPGWAGYRPRRPVAVRRVKVEQGGK
jgi:hypothetical protein